MGKANVALIPQLKPIHDIGKNVRPISIIAVLYKIAEDLNVKQFVKPAIVNAFDHGQFGAIPRSSTTNALISMIDSWFKATDGTGATVRIVISKKHSILSTIEF